MNADIAAARQLAIHPIEILKADDFINAARERLFSARGALGQALIYVHGYNVSFDNAMRRAAQLAYDLKFDGLVFVFSWPSKEQYIPYLLDRKSAELAAVPLFKFLELVMRKPMQRPSIS